MQVEYGLSRARAHIEDGAVSLLDVALAGDLGGGEVTAADDLGVFGLRFLESGEVLLRNYQHVRGSLRIDVLEGEDVIVLVNSLCRNLAAEDAAKKAVGGRISHIWLTPAAYLTKTITLAGGSCQRPVNP
jgi:hypothetical protein